MVRPSLQDFAALLTRRTAQTSLFDPAPVDHPADALEAISAWLDAHPELLDDIVANLDAGPGACEATAH